MKRTVLILCCAATALALTACSKNSTEGKNPEGPGHTASVTAGVYHPERHIDYTAGRDGVTQRWMWDGDNLEAIVADDQCGGYDEVYFFVTDDKSRVVKVRMTDDGISRDAELQYNAAGLARVSLAAYGEQMLDLNVTSDDKGHITKATATIDKESLAWLMEMASGELGPAGDTGLEDALAMLDVQSADMAATLDWHGENVARRVLKVGIESHVTLGALRNLIDLGQLLGDYAALADMMPDSTRLALNVTLNDTADYTYDDKTNPTHGLLYKLSPAVLCANNVRSETSRSAMSVAIIVPTFMGDFPFEFPMPLPASSASFTYEYDDLGYPVSSFSEEEGTVTYHYKD
ncbi:MAG: hypothetical protein IJ760_03570 [Bacteroidales bacterium]|nr:hypothetical protein [Bacteroidales bacterium]